MSVLQSCYEIIGSDERLKKQLPRVMRNIVSARLEYRHIILIDFLQSNGHEVNIQLLKQELLEGRKRLREQSETYRLNDEMLEKVTGGIDVYTVDDFTEFVNLLCQ